MERDDELTRARDDADVRAALGGDLEAYGRIVDRYQDVALRAAWLVVRDEATAQDVCQEAFLRVHRSLHRFRLGEPMRPWLLRIVTNLAKNDVRARGRRNGLLGRLRRGAIRIASAPERAVEAAESRADMLEAIARLAPDDREVIHLRYFLDLSEAEMASVLHVRAGTVKSRLSRARARLRVVLAERYPELRPEALVTEDLDA